MQLTKSSDVFGFSSIQEALGKTWPETMVCLIPVVCLYNTSAAEMVNNKIDGYIVNEINADELHKKLIDFLIN